MMPTQGLVPASGIRLADAMAAWWPRIRPTETEALAWWKGELQQAGGEALAAGDHHRAAGAADALARLQAADAAERHGTADRALLAQYGAASAAFVAVLASGRLSGRVLASGRECALPASFWLTVDFMTACWLRPAIYLDRAEFEAWLAAATEPARVPFSELCSYLTRRAADRDRLPTESDDWNAAKARFGAHISRTEIRDVRSIVYAGRRNKPGRPRKSAR